jgi:hypothetical protein
MVNPTPTSFYADGTTYDEAEVVTNDHQSSSQASAAPSSFFTDGGLVGAEDVTHSDVAPSNTSSPMPSSFFTDGGLVGAETVTNNDNVPDSSPSPAPTSFYPDGNLYDYLSQESEVVALLRQLADTTTTNAASASADAATATAAANTATTAVQSAAGTATPLMDGTAAVGTSPKWAHEDHVHPKDPSLASVSYVDTKVAAVVNSAPATLDTLNELASALGDDPNFATTVSTQIGLKADKTYVDAQDAAINTAKADKTYVDAQDLLLIPHGQCKFVLISATVCRLIPFNGNKIKVNGKLYSIPAAGIDFTNATLSPGTVYYAYVAVNGAGALVPSWGTGAYTVSVAAGNEGVVTHYQTDTLTLVGAVYMNSSTQFADTATWRGVRSWFNEQGVRCASFAGSAFTPATGAWTEDTASRVVAFFWKGEQVDCAGWAACATTAQGGVAYTACYLNGNAVSGNYAFHYTPFANYYQTNPVSTSFDQLQDGPVTLSLAGQSGSASSNAWSLRTLTVTTLRR